MIHLYQDPNGEKIFQKSNPSIKQETMSTFHSASFPVNISELTDEERVSLLQIRITEMEIEIEKKTKRIDELEKCVRS